MIYHDTRYVKSAEAWKPDEEEEQFLSVPKAAKELGVSRQTLYRALEEGSIEGAIRVRNHWQIPVSYITEALGGEKLELPEAALAKMQELVEAPTKPSERLRAAAKRLM